MFFIFTSLYKYSILLLISLLLFCEIKIDAAEEISKISNKILFNVKNLITKQNEGKSYEQYV